MSSPRIYLDNAATSWPKPGSVNQAVSYYLTEIGAPAGRGTYREASAVERRVDEARRLVGRLLGVSGDEIVFTFNGTDSLNAGIHGLLRPGDHVVTSAAEHNSVLRPLAYLEDRAAIKVSRVRCSQRGEFDPDEVVAALRPHTRLVALTHASNVTGTLQPIAEIGQRMVGHPALFLVDCAQTAGHVSFTAAELGADLIACSGHKGLLGPLGIGVLWISPRAHEQLQPVRQGGTGTASSSDRQPDSMPDKYETGNHNVPAIYGLAAAAEWLLERGVDEVRRHETTLHAQLVEGLRALSGVTIYGPTSPNDCVGVLSINVAGFSPQEVASMLDSTYSIQIRSGIHCAPLMHEALGTIEVGGTVRISPGTFNTQTQIERVVEAIGEIATAAG